MVAHLSLRKKADCIGETKNCLINDKNLKAYEVECWCTKYHCECLKWQKEQAKQHHDWYDDIDFDNDPEWICTDHKVEVKQLTINFEL